MRNDSSTFSENLQPWLLSDREEGVNMPKQGIVNAEEKVECVQESLAGRSIPSMDECLFLNRGDYCTIQYHGHVALLKSTRGLRYLAILLRAPRHEFHVRDLLGQAVTLSSPATAVAVHQRVTGRLDAGIPLLDAQAKSEFKRRLEELRRDLNEAERFNDIQRQTERLNELQAISDYIASAIGLGGRDRKTSSDAERARSAVTKCIKKGIRQIGEAIPVLGYHLGARIKTGYFCSYNPHPERPVAWKF
jgi:hypothetical protein